MNSDALFTGVQDTGLHLLFSDIRRSFVSRTPCFDLLCCTQLRPKAQWTPITMVDFMSTVDFIPMVYPRPIVDSMSMVDPKPMGHITHGEPHTHDGPQAHGGSHVHETHNPWWTTYP